MRPDANGLLWGNVPYGFSYFENASNYLNAILYLAVPGNPVKEILLKPRERVTIHGSIKWKLWTFRMVDPHYTRQGLMRFRR